MGLLIYNPGRYMKSVTDGIMLFAASVLPAMFPFFFFSKILTGLGFAEELALFTGKPVKMFFNAPDIGGYIFVMSILSGYPMGAKLIADAYESGLCTADECKALTSFTSTSGPLFVLGTIATSMFHDYKAGLIILFTHYAGALINGIIFKNRKKSAPILPATSPKKSDYDTLLSDAINGSIASILAVGGYIAIFNMIITALGDVGAIALISKSLTSIKIPYALTEGMLSGLIEVTRGALTLSESGLTMKLIIPITAGLVSFGGLSVTLQSLTFLSKCNVKPLYYLATKGSQAIVTGILSAIITQFFY